MSLKTIRTSSRFFRSMHAIRCFNVAAITALGVWHGYAFYASHAYSRTLGPMRLELSQAQDHCCLRLQSN